MLSYVTLDARGETGWDRLAASGSGSDKGRMRAFYFSVGPSLFGDLAERLQQIMAWPDGQCRIVVEKPFGRDLKTAKAS